jgi:hypothetical protein
MQNKRRLGSVRAEPVEAPWFNETPYGKLRANGSDLAFHFAGLNNHSCDEKSERTMQQIRGFFRLVFSRKQWKMRKVVS